MQISGEICKTSGVTKDKKVGGYFMSTPLDLVKDRIKKLESEELKGPLAAHIQHVGDVAPEMFEAYNQWRELVLKDSALPRKVKLLIVVGIMTVLRAEDALTLYSQIALNAGASKEELLDAMSVGILFSGGPSIVAMATALKNLEI
ncbi:MAG: carboxymuconolactone decarboxylase family protein [Acidobacteria bacterium]|nr:carboxymuconolactone decarboxylase family protein [Acidobacteriota bacterium]